MRWAVSEDWSSWWSALERQVDHRGIEAGGNWSQVFDLVRQVDRSMVDAEDGVDAAVYWPDLEVTRG